MIMMVMMTQKGTMQDLLQSSDCVVNCFQHVHSSGHGTIMYKSRVYTHQALIICNMSAHSKKGLLSY